MTYSVIQTRSMIFSYFFKQQYGTSCFPVWPVYFTTLFDVLLVYKDLIDMINSYFWRIASWGTCFLMAINIHCHMFFRFLLPINIHLHKFFRFLLAINIHLHMFFPMKIISPIEIALLTFLKRKDITKINRWLSRIS